MCRRVIATIASNDDVDPVPVAVRNTILSLFLVGIHVAGESLPRGVYVHRIYHKSISVKYLRTVTLFTITENADGVSMSTFQHILSQLGE